jgi:hypothetical protein
MRIQTLVLLGMVLLAPLGAQQTAKAQKARKIVDDAVEALGGERFLNMRNRVEQGRSYAFYNEKLSGLSRAKFYIRYLTAPEPLEPNFYGIRERRAFGKKEDVFIVYNEDGGFEATYRGAKPLPQETVDQYKESLYHNVLYLLRVRLKERGMEFDYDGADIHENQPCDKVTIVDSLNRSTKVWFNQSTHLPLKQRWEHRDPRNRDRIEEITIFDKYRDVGHGVMWPYVTRRERNGNRNYEMYCDEVQINQNLGDELFTLSAGTMMRESGSSNIRPGRK